MGYTHYYSRSYTESDGKAEFLKFREGAERIIIEAVASGVKIADAFGEKLGRWENTDARVAFNGFDEEAHETFAWDATVPAARDSAIDNKRMFFNFCKTARKPYDAVVVACLLLLKDCYGDAVDISSDGDWSEWQDGRALYQTVFGVEAVPPYVVEDVQV
jgi:hypothetical protein